VSGFQHEALFYANRNEFLAGTVPFIRGGLAGGEPVLVVESAERIAMLRGALDDEADRVMFADMAAVGQNPARIIPAWRDFVDVHGKAGTGLRGIGEPIWSERTADQLVECQRHESLLNVAFAGGRPWRLLCPYDTSSLDDAVIDEARRSHAFVTEGGAGHESAEFRGVDASGARFELALPEPQSGPGGFAFDRDNLLELRGKVATFATASGLRAARATELVTAVNEVATNSIEHGGGGGVARMWRTPESVICEVRDAGDYRQPLADRERPGESPRDSRGLWLANQLCDLVQIRALTDGTVVRLHLDVERK
jgi:anti-sigma regulatory factor (Ser/Thr protein kinase)